MKPRYTFFACAFLQFTFGLAQNSAVFPRSQQQHIFNTYYQKFSEFSGIFDSTESVFLVHQDSAVQSRFDSSCLLSHGKTWHRGQITDFTTYITIDTIIRVEKNVDTSLAENDFWALQLPALKIPGNALWKCEGEFSMNENTAQKFSGKFSGTFTIYFIYDAAKNRIVALEQPTEPGLEPAYSYYGFWKSYSNIPSGAIAFFFANTKPTLREDGSSKLPDLRFQADGSQSFSNIAIFSPEVQKPPVNWFQ